MKREIKFRAWDDARKEMHHEFQFIKSGDEGNDWIIFISDKQTLKTGFEVHVHNPYFRQQFRIMQFTGLKDKNGKEIYEGDILCNPKQLKGTVVYYEAGFYLEAKRKDSSVWYMPLNTGMLLNKEVIGNIYENPELIKQ